LIVRHIGFVCVSAIALLSPASAAEDGCEKFAWPLSRERAWFAAPDKRSVAAGESLAALPNGGFIVRLQPGSEASFALPPERKPRSEGWFGGIVRLPAPSRPGILQVTVSDEAWIDVVQDGRYVRSIGSTGRSDCPGLRKSIRFELGPTALAVQLSAVAMPTIVVAIARAD
jgi:hypothetical protein